VIARTAAHQQQRRLRSGLSLLEVLIALAIFLFSLAAITQLIDIGNANALEISWLGKASLLAQSRLAEVMAGSIALSSQSEVTCDEDPDWNWSIDAEPDNAPGLYRVKITVGRNRPDGTRFETVLNQMVFDPNSRGATDGSDGAALATPATSTGTTGTGTTGTGTTGTGTTGTGTTKTGGN
jgi:type II secretion system protein I